MDVEDREFFELLRDEGMEGVLKQYVPIEVLVEDLDIEIKKLKKENAELIRALYLAAKNERGDQHITTRSIYLKYLNQAQNELDKEGESCQ